jgi:hypothetical protein
LFGSTIAKFSAASGFMFHTIATITSGKTILMPNTAIAIHQVRNLRCRVGDISAKTDAFTTALSKESDISNIHNTNTIKTDFSHAIIFISAHAPRKKPITIAINVNIADHLKNCLNIPFNKKINTSCFINITK